MPHAAARALTPQGSPHDQPTLYIGFARGSPLQPQWARAYTLKASTVLKKKGRRSAPAHLFLLAWAARTVPAL